MRNSTRRCCGLLPNPSTCHHSLSDRYLTNSPETEDTQAIALYNVLHAEVSPVAGGDRGLSLTITYAKPASKTDVTVTTLRYPIAHDEKDTVESWTTKLLDLAYGPAKRNKTLKVLVNPFGGKGTALNMYQRYAAPVFAAAGCKVDMQVTSYRGHAIEIAEEVDIDACDAVVCCSGDGLPYEVFNGLGKKGNAQEALAKVAVVMIPGGSGNAMAWNLCGTGSNSVAALAIVKGIHTPLDLVSITQGNTRTLSFLSQSFGIVADSDLGTEDIRWMGAQRFTYGFLARLMRRAIYPCELAVKVEMADKKAIKEHYTSYVNAEPPKRTPESIAKLSGGLPELKYGTVLDRLPEGWEVIPSESLANFYAGNMPIVSKDTNFFPAAVPCDGLMDIITVDGTTSRATTLKMMTQVADGGFFDMPEVNVRKATAYRLVPREKEGYISVDGEQVPFEAFQVEIHQGLGSVLSKSGHLYEATGPR